MASFLAVFGMLMLWHGSTPYETALAVCLVAAIVGALTELLSRRVDDNFAIPIVVGAAVWVTLAAMA